MAPPRFVQQAINALTTPDGSAIPNTRTRTSYGFTLHTAYSGRPPRVIGALQEVRFSQGRDIKDVYEVNALANGMPIDQVPEALRRREITFRRFDTFSVILEEIFGAPEFNTLLDVSHPLVIREAWKDPSGLFSTTTRVYQYPNVVIADYDRAVSVDNRIVVTNIVLKWRGNKTRVL